MSPVESLKTHNKFKQTEIGEIPVDWKTTILSEVAEINMGQSPPSAVCFDEPDDGRIPFFQGKTEFGKKYPKPLHWCSKPTKIAEKDDVLVCVRAPVGDVNVALEKSCIGRGLAAIRGTSAEADFLYFVMDYYRERLARIGQGSTFEAVNKDVLLKFLIPSPPKIEQKKIAEILSTVDAAIEKIDTVIEATKQLKKGLMRQLLTRGIGHKKFKNTPIGEMPESWQVVELKDIVEKKYGIVDGPFGSNLKTVHYRTEGIPIIQSGFVCSEKFVANEYQYVDREKFEEQKRSAVHGGDIVMAKIGANAGACAILPLDHAESILAGNSLKITPDETKCHRLYLLAVLQFYREIQKIQKLRTETAQPALSLASLKKLKILLPPLEEQKKIAGILTAVDQEIEKEIFQRKKLENLKKSLMAILLTGKVRIKS